MAEFRVSFKPFEEFLDPIFSSRGRLARVTESGIHNHGIEAVFALITIIVVLAGWYFADLMYGRRQ